MFKDETPVQPSEIALSSESRPKFCQQSRKKCVRCSRGATGNIGEETEMDATNDEQDHLIYANNKPWRDILLKEKSTTDTRSRINLNGF
jgi:hypothetical protein